MLDNPLKVYIIVYDGHPSQEGYSTFALAEEHLHSQGYFHNTLGWEFTDDCNNEAKIFEISIKE